MSLRNLSMKLLLSTVLSIGLVLSTSLVLLLLPVAAIAEENPIQDASDCLPAKADEVSSLEDPGALSLAEMAACISEIDGNFAWMRDVTLANDVEWLDRGYRGTYSGIFTKADPEQKPKWKRGDLLFASMGMAGIFVFDVSERRLDESHLVGHLHIQDQSALLLQLDAQRGVVFAGGNDYGKPGRPPLINAWDVRYVNASPKTEIKPSPAFSVNKPWRAGHLAVDPTGMGLLYTWSNSEGPIAVPIDSPQFSFSGLYLPEEEDLPPRNEREDGEVLPSIQKLTQRFVPLGVPRVVKLEEDDAERAEQRDQLEAENTAAFKVRLALPGSFGDKLTAKVESLRTLPELRHLGKADLGAAVMPPGGPGWPDASVTVTLRRLGVGDDEQGHDPNVAGGEGGHFSEAYNLYESEETILLLADPRARRDYKLQDVVDTSGAGEDNSFAVKHDEKAACRNCDWPQYLPDPKGDTPPQPEDLEHVEELLAGRYMRALLFVDPDAPQPVRQKTQAAIDFFENQGDNYPTPAGYADIAAPADAVPSPIQVTLAEPAQNPAMWSPGEAGVSVALTGGDLMLTASDHVVGGRGIPFTFDRTYRSHSLGYGPLGSAGWGANLFARLREIDTTGEVEYHDGRGHVWRFYPNAEPDAPVPDEDHYDEDFAASYHPPKGVYLRLQKLRDDRGWRLIGRHHDTAEFDAEGRLTTISDRHRRGQDPEDQGNTLHLRYDVFGQLIGVTDDLARAYEFEYYDDPKPENEGGDGDKYGLLRKITDFADREIEYEFDDERRLTKVRYPEVKNPVDAYRDFSYEGDQRPFLEYTYDPQEGVAPNDDDEKAILHGEFAQLRISEVFLPDFLESGRRVPRARFQFDSATGRFESVSFPTPQDENDSSAGVVWELEPPANQDDDARPLDGYTVRAPWGHEVDYLLEKGRTVGVEQLLEVVNDEGESRPEVLVKTEFDYTDDGRLQTITYPDGGQRINCYGDSEGETGGCQGGSEDVDHLAKANVVQALTRATTERGQGTAEYDTLDTAASYQEDNLVSSVTDGLSRGIQLAVPSAMGSETMAYQTEGVQSKFDYDAFGRIKDTQGGLANPFKVKKSFHEDAEGKNQAGLTKRIEAGTGQFWSEVEYDEQFNPDKSETSQGTRTETRYDSWDRPVQTISGLSDGRYRPVGTLECGEEGARQELAFDAAGHVVRIRKLQDYVDSTGNVQCRWVETRYQYNAREQVIGVFQTHLADPNRQGEVLTDPIRISESVYDSYGRVFKQRSLNLSDPAIEEVYSYDTAGRVRGVKIGDAGEKVRGYDAKNRVVLQTDGHQGQWLGRFDVWGRVFFQKHATGAFELAYFDESNNLTRQESYDSDPFSPSGDPKLMARLRTHFNSFGAVERVATTLIDSDDQKQILITEQEYDDAGRLKATWSGPPKSTDPECADVATACLDTSKARREKEILYERDTGRLLEERFGGDYRAAHLYAHRYEYHPDNASPQPDRMIYLESVPGQEPLEETGSTKYERDAFGRVVTERKSDGSVTHVTYDRSSSRPIRIQTGADSVTRMSFDGIGKQLQVFRPNGRGRTLYVYDLDGRMLRQITTTDSDPWITRFTYDRTGRTRRVDYHDGTYEESTYHPDNTVATFRTRDGVSVTHAYDEANHLLSSVPTAGELATTLVDLDAGDFADWDELSRPTSLRRGSPGSAAADSDLTVAYPAYDLAGRPNRERVGSRAAMAWTYDIYSRPSRLTLPVGLSHDAGTSFQGFTRQFDTLDRVFDISGLGALTAATVGVTWQWGGSDRLYGYDTKTALGTAARYGYIGGAGPQGEGDQPPSSEWKLGTLTWGAGAGPATEVPGTTWGQFALGWRGVDGDPRDGVKIGRQVKTGLDAGGLDLFAGMGWTWKYDVGVRMHEAYPGRGNLDGVNARQVPGFIYDYGEGDELDRIVDQFAGKVVDVETGAYGRIASRDGVDFAYDASGRRTEDDRYVYRWNWRSELMEVTVKDTWPSDGEPGNEQTPFAGHQIRYDYDAKGRLTRRTHWGKLPDGDGPRPFIERRDYVWEHQGLVSEVGFGDAEGTIKRWRKTYVPGPAGLDDAPQVMVENLAFPGSQHATGLYTYLRDELGTVVGIVAEEESSDPQNPTLPARYLYTPYGEAYLETGPELRQARFDAGLTELEGVIQAPGAEHKGGGLEIRFSSALKGSTIAGGVVVERLGLGGWQSIPDAEILVALAGDPMVLQVMTLGGWAQGAAYRVRLETTVEDTAGRALAEEKTLDWSVPGSGDYAVAFDQRFAPEFENTIAASDTLGGRFPGGQNHLFQGLWTDPVTGLSYARARWYDARNVSWISEDPLADIDSPNLYAFVGWTPNMATDPFGMNRGNPKTEGSSESVYSPDKGEIRKENAEARRAEEEQKRLAQRQEMLQFRDAMRAHLSKWTEDSQREQLYWEMAPYGLSQRDMTDLMTFVLGPAGTCPGAQGQIICEVAELQLMMDDLANAALAVEIVFAAVDVVHVLGRGAALKLAKMADNLVGSSATRRATRDFLERVDLPEGQAAKITTESFERGGLDEYVVRQMAEILAEDPVARAAYSQLQARGIHPVLDFGPAPRQLMGEGGSQGIRIYMQNHSNAREAVSTLVHEARHSVAAMRGLNQMTRWAEWQARAREFLMQNKRRPNASERAAIWDEVNRLYPELPLRE